MLNRKYKAKTGCAQLIMNEYAKALDDYSDYLVSAGYPSHGSNFELMAEMLTDEYNPLIDEAESYLSYITLSHNMTKERATETSTTYYNANKAYSHYKKGVKNAVGEEK